MSWRLVLLVATLLLTGRVDTAWAQGGRLPPANACNTQWGWCQLPQATVIHGAACACLTAQNAQVPGITKFIPTADPPSPYLRPHVAPPTTIR